MPALFSKDLSGYNFKKFFLFFTFLFSNSRFFFYKYQGSWKVPSDIFIGHMFG